MLSEQESNQGDSIQMIQTAHRKKWENNASNDSILL
jgi:hypothetical protein